MITPSFNVTATERVLPRLALDFTTASLDVRVTVTRALDTATRFNSNGYVETVNANLPRFDYDPLTFQCKGLLVEETRQNLLLQSKSFVSPWSIGTSVLLTPNAVVSPDGTQNATKLIENTNTGGHQLVQAVTTTATATAYGVFAKRGERNWIALGITDSGSTVRVSYFDLLNGVKGTTATGITSSITNVGNGWYWCVCVVGTALAGSNNARIYVTTADNTTSYTGDGTSGIYIWQADLQPGAFMTSPVFTTTTSLTRNADAVTMTGTNFSDWYNATEGTFAARGTRFATGLVTNILGVSDGTSTNRIRLYQETNNRMTINTSVLGSTTTGNGGATYGVAAAYSSGGVGVSCNGGTVAVSAAGAVPTGITSMDIGRNSPAATVTLNGWLQSIRYWPQRLTNAELQAFSK